MMDIPLCRMIGLQVVRPALVVDIEKLKVDFVHGYRPGAAMFYVSITNFVGSEQEVLSEDSALWDWHWQRRHREFEAFLQADPDLRFLSNKFFFVWDGNHRYQAWMEHILQAHSDNLDWHYRVHSIVLQTKDSMTSIITATHDINKATKNSHVKTNLVHTLHRMRKVGTLEYTQFKGLLTDDEFEAAKKHFENNKENRPWYCLPRAKFLEYIYNVSIIHRSDSQFARSFRSTVFNVKSSHSRISHFVSIFSMILLRLGTTPNEEETPVESQSASGLRAAVNVAMDAKKAKLNTPFTKYLAIVNPNNGVSFLLEVCSSIPTFVKFFR